MCKTAKNCKDLNKTINLSYVECFLEKYHLCSSSLTRNRKKGRKCVQNCKNLQWNQQNNEFSICSMLLNEYNLHYSLRQLNQSKRQNVMYETEKICKPIDQILDLLSFIPTEKPMELADSMYETAKSFILSKETVNLSYDQCFWMDIITLLW